MRRPWALQLLRALLKPMTSASPSRNKTLGPISTCVADAQLQQPGRSSCLGTSENSPVAESGSSSLVAHKGTSSRSKIFA
eukprot:3273259-Pyramimonas_sp.AAC.1